MYVLETVNTAIHVENRSLIAFRSLDFKKPSETKPLDSSCWVLRKEPATMARMKYYQEPCLFVQRQYKFHPRNLSHLELRTDYPQLPRHPLMSIVSFRLHCISSYRPNSLSKLQFHRQLNRWPCHSLTQSLSQTLFETPFDFDIKEQS